MELKKAVHDFWNEESCGEALYLADSDMDGYREQARIRYQLEPYILDFAEFNKWKGKKVLEIGVGLGADHQKFAEAGSELTGIDFTARAIEYTRKRLQIFGLDSDLKVADAENLPFDDGSFDCVYAWGVLHHTPDTPRAIHEVLRVLKPEGTAKVMIYHKYSLVGFMLWIRYGLFRLRPWLGLAQLYGQYLESPGTKAYSVREGMKLFQEFSRITIRTVLSHGDLLSASAGQRHRGLALSFARLIWPRWIIRRVFPQYGLFMLITATK